MDLKASVTFDRACSDVAFWTDDELLAIDSRGDLWRHRIEDGRTELHTPRATLLAAGAPEAPSGGYRPQLVCHRASGTIVVRLAGHHFLWRRGEDAPWGPLDTRRVGSWGPELSFSRDGDFLLIRGGDDGTVVVQTSGPSAHARALPDVPEVCNLTPSGQLVLFDPYGDPGGVHLADLREWPEFETERRAIENPDPGALHPPWDIIASPDDSSFVVAARDRLTWLPLSGRSDHVVVPLEGEMLVDGLQPNGNGELFAVRTTRGVRLWDYRRRAPVAGPVAVTEGAKVVLSISGTRMAVSRPEEGDGPGAVWEIRTLDRDDRTRVARRTPATRRRADADGV